MIDCNFLAPQVHTRTLKQNMQFVDSNSGEITNLVVTLLEIDFFHYSFRQKVKHVMGNHKCV